MKMIMFPMAVAVALTACQSSTTSASRWWDMQVDIAFTFDGNEFRVDTLMFEQHFYPVSLPQGELAFAGADPDFF